MIVQAIYESRARTRITDKDIDLIAARSMSKNVANGVTSFMYYDEWHYLQVVEGRPAEVAETMKRIASNPMHHSLKIRLMNRQTTRGFEGWPFGILPASDFELRRVIRNFGYKNLFQPNVLDALKVLKRTAGRKYRTLNNLEKQALFDKRKFEAPKSSLSLSEEMLGLRG